MIHPDLATMLAVVTTDYPLEPGEAIELPAPRRGGELQLDLGRRRVLDERRGLPARERRRAGSSARRRATRRSRSRSARVCAELAAADRRRRRGRDRARRDRGHRRCRRRAGARDRAPDRDLAARQDGALRARRELGPRARGRRVGAVQRRLRAASIRRRSRSPTTASPSSIAGSPQGVEPDVSDGAAGSSSTSGSATGSAELPDERPLVRLRPDQRGLPNVSRVVVKVGGAVAGETPRLVLALAERHEVCVVHGAGPQISAEMARLGLAVQLRRRAPRHDAGGARGRACVAAGRGQRRALRRDRPRAVPLFGDEIGLRHASAGARARRRGAAESATRGCGARSRPDGSRSSRRSARRARSERERRRGGRRPRPRARRGAAALPQRRAGPAARRQRSPTSIERRRGRAAARRGRARRRDRPEAPRRDRRGARAASTAEIGGRRCSCERASPGPALLPTYARRGRHVRLRRGLLAHGRRAGKRYLDLLGGIAVVSLGHRHPAPLAAAHGQLDALWHVSNLYCDRADGQARRRCCRSALRRRAARSSATPAPRPSRPRSSGRARRPARPGVVALESSFHGRTHGALAVTGQPAKRAAWEPLAPAVRFAILNDVASLEAARRRRETAAILIEPVQGEGGVTPPSRRSSPRPGCSPTSTAPCSSSTRCRAASAGPARSSPGSSAASRPTQSRSRRGSRTGCRSARSSSPTAPPRARRRRPRQHVRRQPRGLRGCVRGRRGDRRRTARGCRDEGSRARRRFRGVTGRGARARARSDARRRARPAGRAGFSAWRSRRVCSSAPPASTSSASCRRSRSPQKNSSTASRFSGRSSDEAARRSLR